MSSTLIYVIASACSREEKKSARLTASQLMRRRDPKKLAHNPSGETHVEEAKKIILMGLSARSKFNHLYTSEGLQASQRAFDLYQKYSRLLKGYPDWLQELGFRVFKIIGSFQVVDLSSGQEEEVLVDNLPKQPTSKDIRLTLARRNAIIDFVYNWCVDAAGDRDRDFQQHYNKEGATVPAEQIQRLLKPYIRRLNPLAEYSHPVTHHVIDRLLINPKTDLPFNIFVPF